MNSLLRANRNYKDDYRNKVRSLNRSMALKMAAMNRTVMEAIEEGSCKYIVLCLYRVSPQQHPPHHLNFETTRAIKNANW